MRKQWPDVVKDIQEEEWNELGPNEQWLGNARYSEDIAARKFVTGQEYWQGFCITGLIPIRS